MKKKQNPIFLNNTFKSNLVFFLILQYFSIVMFVNSQTISTAQFKAELITQTGNTEPANGVIISANNKLLASFTDSHDETDKVMLTNIIIWNISDSKIVRVFSGKSRIRSISFSPDTRLLVSVEDYFIKLLDVITGEEIKSIPHDYTAVKIAVFSPDGKKVAFEGDDQINIWDLEKGRFLNADTWCNYFKFSPDNKLIACLEKQSIDFIDSETGKSIKYPTPWKENEIENMEFTSINFSPDGKRIVILGDDFIDLFDVETGARLNNFKSEGISAADFFKQNSELAKSDLEKYRSKYKEIRSKEIFYKGLKFINNEQFVTLVSDRLYKNYRISNLFTGESQTLNFKKNPLTQLSIPKFSDDGRFLYYESDLNQFTIFDANNWKEINIVNSKLESHSVNNLTLSPQQKLLVNLNNLGAEFWDLRNGEYWRIPDNKGYGFIGFSSDESLAALYSEKLGEIPSNRDGNLKLIDYSKKKTIAVIEPESKGGYLWFNEFSPDKKLIAITEDLDELGSSLKLFDTQNGKFIKTLTSVKSQFDKTAFDPTWKLLAFAERDGDDADSVKILDIDSGKILYTIKPPNQYPPFTFDDGKSLGYRISKLKFSNDGQKLVIANINNVIRVIDLKSGKQTNISTKFKVWGSTVDFSSDARNIIVSTADEVPLNLWNLATNKITELPVKPKEKNITFKPGERGSIEIISPNGKILGNIYTANANDWLVTTPEGMFDGTPNAWKQLIWRFDNNTFNYAPVEAFLKEFYRPGLLQDIINGNEIEIPTQDLSKIDIRQPKVSILAVDEKTVDSSLLPDEVSADKKSVRVKIEITDNNSEPRPGIAKNTSSDAQDVRLFRNGSLVKLWNGNAFKLAEKNGCRQIPPTEDSPRKAICETDIQISAGKNEFTVYGFNRENVKSSDDTAIVNGAESLKRDGTLYVLAVGVNKYQNADYNLNYAVKDVVEIGKTLRDNQAKLGNLKQYSKTEIITLTDELATKENILKAFARFANGEQTALPANASDKLKAEFAKIKQTQPEDAFIIYFAGHGVSKGQRFYLLPHNFTGDAAKLEEQSVSDLELNDTLEKVDAGKILMVIDACQSGAALGGKNDGKAPMNSKGFAQLAYDKGMLILTAAQSQQAALEAVKIGDKTIENGLLTYALLQAFSNNQADKDGNKQLWEREWFDFAVNEVPMFQREAMKRREVELKNNPQDKSRSGIYYVNGDKKENAEDRSVQTPRVFYRREIEIKPFILANP